MSTKTKWVIDPAHSDVKFKVKHMMISSVSGQFNSFDATVETSSDDFKDAAIDVAIDVDSVNTKNEDRDNHLKSDDFFNAASYPKMTFKANGFDGEKLRGELSIRDITKEVVLNADFNGVAVDPYGQTKAGFELTGEINRKEFGLKWDAVTEAGSIVVSDKIKLMIDAQFIKQ